MKTKHHLQKIIVRRVFGKKLYRPLKALKVVLQAQGRISYEISRFLQDIVEDDFIIFDVGANLGQYSLRLNKRLRSGMIYAFEPVYDNYRYLKKIKKLLSLRHVDIYHLAVSDETGRRNIYIPYTKDDIEVDTRASLTLRPDKDGDTRFKSEMVGTVTVDEFFSEAKLTKVDIIKSDTEGHDEKVMAGAAAVIREHKPLLLVESAYGEPWLERLTALGYVPFYLNKRSRRDFTLVPASRAHFSDSSFCFSLLILIHAERMGRFTEYLGKDEP